MMISVHVFYITLAIVTLFLLSVLYHSLLPSSVISYCI